MRKDLLIIAAFFISTLIYAQEKDSITFLEGSWEDVLKVAEQKSKPIFLFASTPVCAFSNQMEREVFSEKEVADFYNLEFVNYKVNIDDDSEGEALAEKYKIVASPTYLYFNEEAALVHQSGSAKSAADFIRDGKNSFNPEKALISLEKKYQKGDRSPSFLFNYATALSGHLADNAEEKIVKEYLETQSAQQLESEKNLRFIFSKYLGFDSPATQYFFENQDKFSGIFGEEEVKNKAGGIITRSARVAGRAGNEELFLKVKRSIQSNFEDSKKFNSLAEIHFLGGQQKWLPYAEATLEYAKSEPGNDWKTLYETSIYLNVFSEDVEAWKIGARIMEMVVKTNRTYDNLYLYAQLQNKSGNPETALRTAKEALDLATESGEPGTEAANLISEIEKEEK